MKLFRLFIVPLFFLAGPALMAQSKGFYLGAEGGAGIAALHGNMYDRKSPLPGYAGGVFIQYNFERVLSIRTGWSYDLKGTGFETPARADSTRWDNVRAKSKFNYLTVPLLLGFRFGEDLNYFLNVGPYAGFLLKQTTYVPPVGSRPVVITDDTKAFRGAEFGLSLGVGFSYPVAHRLLLSAQIRNNLGLTNINDHYVSEAKSVRTNAVNFMLGVAYRLGGQNTVK